MANFGGRWVETFQRPDGRKLDRTAVGPKAGTAIKLWPDENVTAGLAIAEGLKTALSAAARIEHRGTLLRPAWAAVDAGNLAEFSVLPGAESLTVLVDNDEHGRGDSGRQDERSAWTWIASSDPALATASQPTRLPGCCALQGRVLDLGIHTRRA
jgi:Toprim domain